MKTTMANSGFKDIKRECLIDGKKLHYDVCSSGDYGTARNSYDDKFEYIGSSHTLYLDGKESVSKDLHHFFIKKANAEVELPRKKIQVAIIGGDGTGKTAMMNEILKNAHKDVVLVVGAENKEARRILTEEDHKVLDGLFPKERTTFVIKNYYKDLPVISVAKDKKPKDRVKNNRSKVKRKKSKNGKGGKKR